MDFYEVLEQVAVLLQRRGRVTYRALKIQFQLDDDTLEALKDELLYAQPQVQDEAGRGLVWTETSASASAPVAGLDAVLPTTPSPGVVSSTRPPLDPRAYTPPHLIEKILTSHATLHGERKQVTVLFCDLANSTGLAEQLGPETMHTILNQFFAHALDAVHRYEGTINQFLGDGFMALFGAPIAHEDHARRAVLAALELRHQLQAYNAAQAAGHRADYPDRPQHRPGGGGCDRGQLAHGLHRGRRYHQCRRTSGARGDAGSDCHLGGHPSFGGRLLHHP